MSTKRIKNITARKARQKARKAMGLTNRQWAELNDKKESKLALEELTREDKPADEGGEA